MKHDQDTLREVGEALYGPSWQTPMSEALGVSDRSVRYWAGGRPIPDGIWGEIAALCQKRQCELAIWALRLAPPTDQTG
jgi:hypothetical protein